jgi:hypothetical protein
MLLNPPLSDDKGHNIAAANNIYTTALKNLSAASKPDAPPGAFARYMRSFEEAIDRIKKIFLLNLLLFIVKPLLKLLNRLSLKQDIK